MKKRKYQRKQTVTVREPLRNFPEPEPSTRLSKIKKVLASIEHGFTIFFTDERGKSVKYYCGAVIQEEQG